MFEQVIVSIGVTRSEIEQAKRSVEVTFSDLKAAMEAERPRTNGHD